MNTIRTPGRSSTLESVITAELVTDSTDLGDRRRERALDRVLAASGQLIDDVVIDLTDPERLPEVAVMLFETDHYVERAPLFKDQLADPERTMPFRYAKPDGTPEGTFAITTEYEGLHQLNNTLSDFIAMTDVPGFRAGSYTEQAAQNLRLEAINIQENLAFIGDKEYQRATTGLAQRWKDYLDADPGNQLCVLAGVSSLERYELKDYQRKSDAWVLEDTLLHFSEEELEEKYKGRILTQTDKITTDEDHAKIVLVDDWSISGRQQRDCYQQLANNGDVHKYIESGCVEVNLIAAGRDLIDGGLETHNGPLEQPVIPVYAYFRAKGAGRTPDKGDLHISGLHSAVNYGFQDSILSMVKIIQMVESNGRKSSKRNIALLHVDPIYYDDRIRPTIVEEAGVVVGKQPAANTSKQPATKRTGHLKVV